MSSVGATVTSHAAAKIPTSDVDHGSASATSTAKMSATLVQATGSRQAAQRRRSHRIGAHAVPSRARLTSDVVLKPGSISTSTTSPP